MMHGQPSIKIVMAHSVYSALVYNRQPFVPYLIPKTSVMFLCFAPHPT